MDRSARFLVSLVSCCALAQSGYAQDGEQGGSRANTWGAVLNPSGQVPVGAFKAIYINTNSPRQIIASEIVDDVAINYSWDKFHGIKSEDFGAYWASTFVFKKDEPRIIEVSQSWSKTRIIIDGKIAYEGGNNARTPYTFTKGKHLVEVEYINNWHTTSVRVSFHGAAAPLQPEQVFQELRAPEFRNAEVHFVGLYESAAKDLSVRVDVAPAARPVILVFSSYDAVNWVVNEARRGTVRAVIYGGNHPGSEIRGLDSRKVRVMALSNGVGSYDMKSRCTCVAGVFHCEGSGNLLKTVTDIEKLTGYPMTSFGGAYSAEQMSVPGVAVTTDLKSQVRVSSEQDKQQREQCTRQANPDFDKMFDKPAGG